MNILQQILKSRILLGIISLVVFAVIFIFNRLFPLFADDWVYSFIFENSFFDHSLKPISGLSDIFISQYNHYFLWGGRSVVHFIDQFLLSIDPLLCDAINSLVYLGFIFFIYRLINQGRETNIGAFIFVICFSWVFVPQLTSNVFWITGSANYLWGTFILLLFLYPYYTRFLNGRENDPDTVFKSVIFFITGIIAGWTNENTVPPILLMIFFLGIYLYRKRELPRWMIFGFIGLCVGYLIMVLAPGNYIRMQFEFEHSEKMVDVAFITIIKERIIRIFSKNYLLYMLPLVILYLAMFLVHRKYGYKTEEGINKKLLASISFFIAAHISFFIMIAATTFPLRAMFGMVIYMAIAIGILYSEIEINTKWKSVVNITFIVILACLYTFDVIRKYPSIHLISETFRQREIILEEQKAKGIKDITFEGRIGFHEKYGFEDLQSDSTAWMNREYAKFHGIHSVKAINKE
ncbi:hypothetical protein GGR21_000418 [Dysgonomonas hofstadii]|uniref:Dolichyl-phosphate-mannose-protein mannosyltransferase n=1 Tax=Dysgonomonas hofstadii TaxID=637886 RepID=A0A840CH36_9BACT|nr:DUF6056 family protein [Dysgonomonas hofstadii]MBB4034531.1 hypothetical protein [Dysgonomonas hofstadii]